MKKTVYEVAETNSKEKKELTLKEIYEEFSEFVEKISCHAEIQI